MAKFTCTAGHYSPEDSVLYTEEDWYAVHGTCDVCRTQDELYDGVDALYIRADFCFRNDTPIYSESDLSAAVIKAISELKEK